MQLTEKTEERPFCRPAFSLVEVLVVIGIIALLLAAAIPVFTNKSANARQACREIVKAHLQQARAHAIASGNATAVVIPAAATDDALGAAALTLIEVTNDGGVYVPGAAEAGSDAEGGEALQRWEPLPGGIRFVSGAMVSSRKEMITDQEKRISVPYRRADVSCHYLVFSPNGQIVYPAGNLNLAIAQATNSGGSLEITQKNDGKAVYDLFQINRLTGRTRFIDP